MMKIGDGVEWALHCVLLLSALPAGSKLAGKAMAEFHGVPESYLLKHLSSLVEAGILSSFSGPKGGFGLAQEPTKISLLDVVEAIEGSSKMFRCSEIRRRGPCSVNDPDAYPMQCGINRAMLRAEQAYRSALKAETLDALLKEFMRSVDPRIAALGEKWVEKNIRTTAA